MKSIQNFFKNIWPNVAHFFERKLFMSVFTMAILIYSFIAGVLPVEPFLASALLVFILYLFCQGNLDISQLKVDINGLKISGDTASALQNDHGFLSRKWIASMVMLIVMAYLGCYLKLFVTKEWEYAGTICLIYVVEIFVQGALDISTMNLAIKGFSIDPKAAILSAVRSIPIAVNSVPDQPNPLPSDIASSIKNQLKYIIPPAPVAPIVPDLSQVIPPVQPTPIPASEIPAPINIPAPAVPPVIPEGTPGNVPPVVPIQ